MRNPTLTAIGAGAFSIVAAIAAQDAFAQSGATSRAVRIDVSQLRANVGEPTASWVQNELASALGGRTGPNGAPVTLRIDTLSLSSGIVDCGASRDKIGGVAIIGGVQSPLRASTSYQPGPADRVMIEQINHLRVSQLVQALVFWVSRDLT